MDRQTLFIRLELPPGKNATYGYGRRKVYLKPAARDWAEVAALKVGAAAGRQGWRYDATLDWEIIMTFSVGLRRKVMDVDAPVTLTVDTVTRKLGFDDSKVTRLVVERVHDGERYIDVRLQPRREYDG